MATPEDSNLTQSEEAIPNPMFSIRPKQHLPRPQESLNSNVFLWTFFKSLILILLAFIPYILTVTIRRPGYRQATPEGLDPKNGAPTPGEMASTGDLLGRLFFTSYYTILINIYFNSLNKARILSPWYTLADHQPFRFMHRLLGIQHNREEKVGYNSHEQRKAMVSQTARYGYLAAIIMGIRHRHLHLTVMGCSDANALFASVMVPEYWFLLPARFYLELSETFWMGIKSGWKIWIYVWIGIEILTALVEIIYWRPVMPRHWRQAGTLAGKISSVVHSERLLEDLRGVDVKSLKEVEIRLEERRKGEGYQYRWVSWVDLEGQKQWEVGVETGVLEGYSFGQGGPPEPDL